MTIEFLFNFYKDTAWLFNEKRRFHVKQKFPNVNMGELHRRVVNYQLKKYGDVLKK